LRGEPDMEPRLVEVDHVRQRLRASVVEVRRARCETTQDRALELRHVGEVARDQRAPGVGGLHAIGKCGLPAERNYRKIAGVEHVLPARRIRYPDIQGRWDRVIPDVRRIMADAARRYDALRPGNAVGELRAIQPRDLRDSEGSRVEDLLPAKDRLPLRIPDILPRVKQIEDPRV